MKKKHYKGENGKNLIQGLISFLLLLKKKNNKET
jgi:hypothetical protein